MLDIYAFYIISAIILISSIFVFAERRLTYAVAALATTFFGSALLFFLIGQSLAAILQLIVFVGGLSTYLIVAVATEEKNIPMARMRYLGIVSVAMFAGVSLFLRYFPSQFPNSGANFLSAAALAFQSSYALLYIIAVLLFSTAIGGVIIIKKYYDKMPIVRYSGKSYRQKRKAQCKYVY